MSPDRPALLLGDAVTTYARLSDRITRLASRLRSRGVSPGDRVAYLGPNHPAFVETMFATHVLGAIFVPLNFRLAGPEIDYMLRHSGASALVHAPGSDFSVRPDAVVEVGEAYEKWLEEAGEPAPVDVPVSPDDVAFILYTSGTTGRPKGATLTHANVLWNCFNVLVGVDVASDETTLIGAPLFHVAALNQCLLPTFLKGGRSVIMPSWDVDEAFDLIARHRVTWMFGVSAMFAGLARAARWPGADLSSVRSVMSGGAAVPEALIEAYQSRGLTFCQGYGMTETAPGATFLEARESTRHIGSAGLPVFFAEVRCVSPDLTDALPGSPASPGSPGEVLDPGRLRARRLVPFRRHRPRRRERSLPHRRPDQGHVHLRRRERVPGRGRVRAVRTPGGRRGRGRRGARSAVGRGRPGLRGPAPRGHARRRVGARVPRPATREIQDPGLRGRRAGPPPHRLRQGPQGRPAGPPGLRLRRQDASPGRPA
jgi:fatty-acyl-CoA synthase